MKVLIIYHSADFDGVMSCLVCRKYLLNNKTQYNLELDIDLLGWNYGDIVPDAKRIIEGYDQIYSVDISFPAETMGELAKSGKFIWIDHHITAIQDSEQFGYSDCTGLRRIGTAACELTWEYLFPNYDCPLVVQYLGAWDVFNKGRFDWEGIVNPLQVAFSERYGLVPQHWYDELDDLMLNNNGLLDSIIHDGKIIYSYNQQRSEAAVRKYGFEVIIDGKWKGICLMNTTFGSIQFKSIISKYDCSVVVNRKNRDLYNVSIYIEPEHLIDFNAGEYLKKNYCGGGHKNAAGGVLNFEQFKELIYNQKL